MRYDRTLKTRSLIYSLSFQFDCNLVLMMMLILFFDTHANSLANSENVGKIQLKYSILLQRYLK